ncbi:MAG: nucleoside deaminase [Hyphomicrobiales bacterium]
MTHTNEQLVDHLLKVAEQDIVPLTRQGVQNGNKVFGAAILRKDDLSLVVAGTNNETGNPLWHGEVHTLKLLYELPADQRPAPSECIFFSTHEPCTMCMSAITWGGYDNFTYLFSHEDSRDSFNIPHDLKILKELFSLEPGGYNKTNHYWSSHALSELISECDSARQTEFKSRVEALETTYAEMSATYQANKGAKEIPLK